MKLIDTTDNILSAFKDRNFSLETWENYAQTISPRTAIPPPTGSATILSR